MSVARGKRSGLKLMIPAAFVCVVVQAVAVFFHVRGVLNVVLQVMFFGAWVVGLIGLFRHYREMWRPRRADIDSNADPFGSRQAGTDGQ